MSKLCTILGILLDYLLIPLQKYVNAPAFTYFSRGIWLMIKIRMVPCGIPQKLLDSDPILADTKLKTIRLSRVPAVGEYLVWRDHNFRITKVTHYSEDYGVAAEVEMWWCEST
ncbi:hypothetical protein SD81_017195 [Tolypothrix campylonemoides VB511288]|nr:hypothetical protein SD81_017195 [Tolypothrix campylonemoides VB511288]